MIGVIEPRSDSRRLMLSLLGNALSRPRQSQSERRKILVVRPDHLGDLLFLTPALRRLRTGLPEAEMVGLVGPWGVPVLQDNPNLDRLISWDFPWFDRKPRRSILGPYISLVRLARLLRAEKFDLALQFRPDFWWGALAVRLAGTVEHVGFDVPIVRPFLTEALPLRHGFHDALENLRLAEKVAGSQQDEPLEFVVTDAHRRRAHDLLGTYADGRLLVALQVGAGAPVKLWPTDRVATVGRALRERHGAAIVVIGGTSERALVDTVVGDIGQPCLGLAGQTSLGELAAVLAHCRLALGPDSGPLHLAVAVGTPTLHLYGPADSGRFGPFGDSRRHRVIRSPRPCAPCGRLDFVGSELARHDCMIDISVEKVLELVTDLLRG